MAKRPDSSSKRKKAKRVVSNAVAHVNASFNNTMITLTDPMGNTLTWASAGGCGFKGARKSTPYAATLVGEKVIAAAREHGVREVEVMVRGQGGGRESAIRSLNAAGIRVTKIKDVSSIPFNGCRPPKERRV